ncbi:uncharacterized protein LOC110846978 isoform X3 [Folsomia candida]|uniref:uncharacterized protein LOC110846978 isoform X3 n=1 Tax=Folsomia candida TaxID=158441 RepID=UPI001604AF3C|nr:uncharacterized protein LOC110846978 isoform X3 [Folsomia candida]
MWCPTPSVKPNAPSSRKIVYDWRHESVPRRLFPKPPPPPQWNWGPIDVILESENSDRESIEKEIADDDEDVEEMSSYSQFAVDHSKGGATILEYNHGQAEQNQDKKFFVNPFYSSKNESSSDPLHKSNLEDDFSSAPPLTDSPGSLPTCVSADDIALKNEIVKPELKYPKNSIMPRNGMKRRKIAPQEPCDLIIGQKLTTVRTCSSIYAKPLTKSKREISGGN